MIHTDKLTITKSESYTLGVTKTDVCYHFAFASASNEIELLLYQKGQEKPELTLTIDERYKTGDVFCFALKGCDLDHYRYLYRDQEQLILDPYASRIAGCQPFGEPEGLRYAVICGEPFDWQEEKAPQIPADDLIVYKLHVRGYTKSRTSKVSHKGTFAGLCEKIPYLEELGINAVELMPAYEFLERTEDSRVNYWGYAKGYYMAPKAAYCASYGKCEDYSAEVKNMVKTFHASGIEVIMEFFFPREISAGFIDDCIRYWKKEYHIDGVHLLCDERIRLVLAEDPYLKGLKLFYTNWYPDCNNKNLYEYNEGFLQVARRLAKGDEDQMQLFLDMVRAHPAHANQVNYVTSNNGFTLMDLVSYDRKHNEENGENNRDGADYNLSWNCGVEGLTKSRRILALRMQNRKNLMTMLLLSQGVPMIYAGDEFGNSQNGNNNAYCQDNEIGWVNWNGLGKDGVFLSFVKQLIQFRKKHKVLHMKDGTYMTDYRYYGLPDVSYHGEKAWYPEIFHYSRHAGIMFCGRYAGEETNIYIAFNLHWEEHELALPTVPGRHWTYCFDTEGDFGQPIDDEKRFIVHPRTIVVLQDEKNG